MINGLQGKLNAIISRVEHTYKISIITRTKNRVNLLERAIQSVHGQTVNNFIHVIINDAGDPAPIDALLERHKGLVADRVKVIHNTKSNGMEAATNKAIQSIKSTYLAVHDDDDTWHPEFLERTVKLLDESGETGVVVKTNKITEEVIDGKQVKILKTEPWMPDLKVVNLYRQCIDNQMTPITFLYKRSVYDELGGYDESLPVLGDWDFGIRFLQKHDVEFLDPGFALANYHHRKFVAGSSTSNSFGDGSDKHRYYSNRLMNKYLRQELSEGRLGVGYMMSKLKYDQSNLATIVKRVLPDFVTRRLKKRIQN